MIEEIFQFIEEHLFKRINHKCMFKAWSPVRYFQFVMEVVRQKIVQFQIAFVVLGNANEAGLHPVPEIDAQKGAHPKLRCLSNKVEPGRGIVDIGEHQLGHVVLLGQLQ